MITSLIKVIIIMSVIFVTACAVGSLILWALKDTP